MGPKLLSRKEYRQVQDVEMTWADKMKQQGLLDGKRQALSSLLEEKFGPLPEEAAARLQALESEDELDRYLKAILTASSLDDLGL